MKTVVVALSLRRLCPQYQALVITAITNFAKKINKYHRAHAFWKKFNKKYVYNFNRFFTKESNVENVFIANNYTIEKKKSR